MSDKNQKRAHARTEIVFKIDYRTPTEFLADYTTNAGGGGVFIETLQPFLVGDTITFNISFPGLIDPIVCVGVIRWRRPPEEAEEDKPAGIGVEFKFDDSRQSEEIRSLVGAITDKEDSAALPPGALDAATPAVFRMLLAGPRKSLLRMFHFAMESSKLAAVLDQQKLFVDEVGNAQEAWDHIQNQTYDLVVLDLDMPVDTGLELLGQIQELPAGRRLSVATVGPEDIREKAYAAGADLFLGTPVNLVRLFQSLFRLLDLKKNPDSTRDDQE